MTSEVLSPYEGIFHISNTFSRDEERALRKLARTIGPGNTPEQHKANQSLLRDVAQEQLGLEISTTDTLALLGEPLYIVTTDRDVTGEIARIAERLATEVPKDPEKHPPAAETTTQHKEPKGEDND